MRQNVITPEKVERKKKKSKSKKNKSENYLPETEIRTSINGFTFFLFKHPNHVYITLFNVK